MSTIWRYIFQKPQTEEERFYSILSQTPVFHDLPKKALRRLLQIMHQRVYKPGERVFSMGEPGVGMYVVCEGAVGVYVTDLSIPEEQRGKEVKVAKIEEGQFFGELSLFGACQRSATVRALVPTKLLGVIRPEFQTFIRQYPDLGCELLTRLLLLAGKRLEQTNQELVQAHQELRMFKKQNVSSFDQLESPNAAIPEVEEATKAERVPPHA